jgi:hypothetical protein
LPVWRSAATRTAAARGSGQLSERGLDASGQRVGAADASAVERAAERFGSTCEVTRGGEMLAEGGFRLGELKPRRALAEQGDCPTRMRQRVRATELR